MSSLVLAPVAVWAPELVTIAIGHFLNAGLTIALAAAAASLGDEQGQPDEAAD